MKLTERFISGGLASARGNILQMNYFSFLILSLDNVSFGMHILDDIDYHELNNSITLIQVKTNANNSNSESYSTFKENLEGAWKPLVKDLLVAEATPTKYIIAVNYNIIKRKNKENKIEKFDLKNKQEQAKLIKLLKDDIFVPENVEIIYFNNINMDKSISALCKKFVKERFTQDTLLKKMMSAQLKNRIIKLQEKYIDKIESNKNKDINSFSEYKTLKETTLGPELTKENISLLFLKGVHLTELQKDAIDEFADRFPLEYIAYMKTKEDKLLNNLTSDEKDAIRSIKWK
ncbi:MAG: hypothetical protein HRT98_03390 [Mycoplasmatales bacterium]|nr:hypothetical protein [Mycoplasmatales bacterium]